MVLPSIEDPEKFAEDERLDPEKLIADIQAKGTNARFLSEVDAIVEHVADAAESGDVIAVLSNGGFDGIHQKLLDSLSS